MMKLKVKPDSDQVHRPGRRPRDPRGFTLTELLVVIGIIVVLLAMAVPMYNVMSGDRSVEGGQNVLSAMLQRARTRAIAMQERRGLFFFEDPATGRTMATVVKLTPIVIQNRTFDALELDPEDDEAVALPNGVSLAASFAPGSAAGGVVRPYDPWGVVMFDGLGRTEIKVYIIRNDNSLEIIRRHPISDIAAGLPVASTNAIALFDKPRMPRLPGDNPTVFSAEQRNWLDQNALIVVVNRYNGTLIRGE